VHIEVHTSDRSMFKRCRQSWDFASNLRMNLEPNRPIEPLWMGTGIHLALATYYEPSTPRDPEHMVKTFHQYVQDWVDHNEPDDTEWADRLLAQGTGMLENYGLWAPRHDDFEVVAVEIPFELEVPGMPGTTYAGRMDGLVKDSKGRLWILEHKTAAQFFENEEWLALDDQCGSYLWVLHALGYDCEGVIYNTLKKKVPSDLRPLVNGGFSVAKNQDTTFEIAKGQLREHYGKIPRQYWEFLDFLKTKPNAFFKRTYVRRNHHEMGVITKELREEVLDMVNNPAIYRSPSRLNCSNCQFIAPCISKWEGSDYQFLLDTNYRKRGD